MKKKLQKTLIATVCTSLVVSPLAHAQAHAPLTQSMQLLQGYLPLAGQPMPAAPIAAPVTPAVPLPAPMIGPKPATSMQLLRQSLPLAGQAPVYGPIVKQIAQPVKLPKPPVMYLPPGAEPHRPNQVAYHPETNPSNGATIYHPVFINRAHPIDAKLYQHTNTRGELLSPNRPYRATFFQGPLEASWGDSRKAESLTKSWKLLGDYLPLAKGAPVPIAKADDVITKSTAQGGMMKPSWVQHDYHSSALFPSYSTYGTHWKNTVTGMSESATGAAQDFYAKHPEFVKYMAAIGGFGVTAILLTGYTPRTMANRMMRSHSSATPLELQTNQIMKAWNTQGDGITRTFAERLVEQAANTEQFTQGLTNQVFDQITSIPRKYLSARVPRMPIILDDAADYFAP